MPPSNAQTSSNLPSLKGEEWFQLSESLPFSLHFTVQRSEIFESQGLLSNQPSRSSGTPCRPSYNKISRANALSVGPLLNELLLPLQSDWHLLFQFPLLQSPLLQPAAKWEGKKGWKGLGRNTLYVRLQKSYLVWEDFISATDWKINKLQTVYPMIAECFWQCAVIGLDGVIARPQKGNAECVCPWCNPRRSVEQGWPLFSDGYALFLSFW